MKKIIKFSDLPESSYFWRKNSPFRWLKAFDNIVFSFDKPTEKKQLKEIDELVLRDLSYCYNCQEHLCFQEGDFVCDVCNTSYKNGLSQKEIKQLIVEWTGNINPHL